MGGAAAGRISARESRTGERAVSIFSAVFSRFGAGWTGTEIDLEEVESIDDVADLMRDAAGAHDPGAAEGTMVLVLEADDEWFGLVRVDDHGDPRVFLSDVRVVNDHPVAALLLDSGAIQAPEPVEGTGQKPVPDPGGDHEILDDLGTPPADLVSLTLGGGMLPSDVLADIAERAGFSGPLDSLRI